MFKEGKKPKFKLGGKREQGLWVEGNKEENWEGSCGNTGGPRPAMLKE